MSRRRQYHHALLERRREVATLYIQAMPQWQIAQKFGVSQQQICADLKAIRALWRASMIRDFDTRVELELQKLDTLERTYWEAWERSLQPREVTHTRAVEGDRARREASVQKEMRVVDARFLDGVRQCIADRRALLGLDAPTRFQIDWDNLTPEQTWRLAAGEDPQRVLAPAPAPTAPPPIAEA